VIEDAAQAIGSTYHDPPIGGWGAIGCFSFFPSKKPRRVLVTAASSVVPTKRSLGG
jgi:hypothetical protein